MELSRKVSMRKLRRWAKTGGREEEEGNLQWSHQPDGRDLGTGLLGTPPPLEGVGVEVRGVVLAENLSFGHFDGLAAL